MTDAELLRAVGAALYGPDFHKRLANLLGVQERAVRRWDQEINPVPAHVWHELVPYLDNRMRALRWQLRDRLMEAAQ